jgi:hypothetical protein
MDESPRELKQSEAEPQRSAHCQAAIELLARLDAELIEHVSQRGISTDSVSWTVAEEVARGQVADDLDRREVLQADWDAATDPKVRVKISVEMRQLDKDIQRLLALIKTDLPAAETHTTVRARRAANTRWDHERARNGVG